MSFQEASSVFKKYYFVKNLGLVNGVIHFLLPLVPRILEDSFFSPNIKNISGNDTWEEDF